MVGNPSTRIGDTATWQQIVANVGAIVDELERTFVAEIEAAVGRHQSGSSLAGEF